jgi:hypothetical protein
VPCRPPRPSGPSVRTVTGPSDTQPRRAGTIEAESVAHPPRATVSLCLRGCRFSVGGEASLTDTTRCRDVGLWMRRRTVPSRPTPHTAGASRVRRSEPGRGAAMTSYASVRSSAPSAISIPTTSEPGKRPAKAAARAATARRVVTNMDRPYLGTGTRSTMPSRTESAVAPSSSTSGRRATRCLHAGFTKAFTSSGVTKSRPER